MSNKYKKAYRRDPIVADSSLHQTRHNTELEDRIDSNIKIGIVRSTRPNKQHGVIYAVEVKEGPQTKPIDCVMMTRFGGVHNYEEYGVTPYLRSKMQTPGLNLQWEKYTVKGGDRVVVAEISADGRQGVILGGMHHPARATERSERDISYVSQFNGVRTEIATDGTYRLSWLGNATLNQLALETQPFGQPIPDPVYETFFGGSYFEINTLGSMTLTDDRRSIIKIKKQTGNITLVSGDVRLEIGQTDVLKTFENPTGSGVGIETTELGITADNVTIQHSGPFKITDNAMTINIEDGKIAIGNQVVELLAIIAELVEKIGAVKAVSPNGNCAPLLATPEWVEVQLGLTLLKQITGSIGKPPLPTIPAINEGALA